MQYVESLLSGVTPRRMVAVLCLAGGLFWALLDVEPGIAQPPAAPAGATADAQRYMGVVQCARCHARPSPLDDQNGSTKWVSLTEYHTWSTHDKHAKAHETLDSIHSKQICERLGIEDATAAQECLSCHCNLRKDVWPTRDNWPTEFDRKQGVNCESCHGPGSDYDKPHRLASWRSKSADEKQQLGMVDVRNPRDRAQQCLSCHVGHVGQGKVVTHAMYAAGHPPLPGIEIETFAQNMPRHWRYMDEKPADLPDRERLETELGQRAGELHGPKSVLMGAVMTLGAAVQLVADQSLAATSTHGPPEFSQFDCRLCHHELQNSSSQQVRRLTGRPGRPQFQSWPGVLVEVAIRQAADDDPKLARTLQADYDDRMAGLHAAFAAAPFGDLGALGDPADANSACGRLLAWLDSDLLEPLSRREYDRAAAEGLLRSLCDVALERDHDYDSARQLAWAFRAIDRELRPEADEQDAIRVCLAELAEKLVLDLPWTQQQVIFDQLENSLEAASDYDPADARQAFSKLRGLLPTR